MATARFGHGFLGSEPLMRSCLSAWATSTGSYVLYSLIALLEVRWGFAPWHASAWLIGWSFAWNAALYAAIRSGWSLRRFPTDPGLGVLQLGVGVLFMWMTYALTGPAATVTLMVLASHMVWAVFSLTPRRVLGFTIVMIVGIGLTMLVSHLHDPVRYPGRVQVIAFLFVLVVLPLIARVSVLVTRMQQRMRRQSRELADALERVQLLATRDELTGLQNRRSMNEALQAQIERPRQTVDSICLALLDLDHFKSINDRFGHLAGDEVLRRFAGILTATTRTSDLVARWGGEEFLIAFPGTALQTAHAAVRRMAETLAQTPFDDLIPGLPVSFSAGVVAVNPQAGIDAAFERADAALYRAKANGRNRIETVAPARVPA